MPETFPSADGSASATRNRTAATTAGGTASETYDQYQAGFDASCELDLVGATRRGSRPPATDWTLPRKASV
ncbi:hypothetical protein [Mesorhizobium tamadayense]|uniref:hypothetical protein n=1 Tax=Mesorhizobium tamadayense TaxID=425306 RepID=UPI0026C02141